MHSLQQIYYSTLFDLDQSSFTLALFGEEEIKVPALLFTPRFDFFLSSEGHHFF
jgi:hypothetical protein